MPKRNNLSPANEVVSFFFDLLIQLGVAGIGFTVGAVVKPILTGGINYFLPGYGDLSVLVTGLSFNIIALLGDSAFLFGFGSSWTVLSGLNLGLIGIGKMLSK